MNIDYDNLYKKYNISQKKIDHMKRVAEISLAIADMIDLDVNKEVLYAAAMLHDIGFNDSILNTDFKLMFGHQVLTKERLINEGLNDVANSACNHNFFGLTKKESIDWGYDKGISLVPRTIESKIIAFADSFRKHRVTKNCCWKVSCNYSLNILSKNKILNKVENRKKRVFNFLVKHGLDYEKLYDMFI